MSIFDRNSKTPLIGMYQNFGKKVVCPNCGNDKFEKRDILLNTAGMSFLGLDWANRSASALICTNCTRIEWYLNQPALIYN